MTASFFIELPNGRTISAQQHPDPRGPVQQVFQDFNPASGVVKVKKIMPIDCSAGTPAEQGIPNESRKGRLQLWMNYKGQHHVVIPMPDANGKTANFLFPLAHLGALGDTLKNLERNLTSALTPKPTEAAPVATATDTPDPVDLSEDPNEEGQEDPEPLADEPEEL